MTASEELGRGQEIGSRGWGAEDGEKREGAGGATIKHQIKKQNFRDETPNFSLSSSLSKLPHDSK